jgi:hypothetical protein
MIRPFRLNERGIVWAWLGTNVIRNSNLVHRFIRVSETREIASVLAQILALLSQDKRLKKQVPLTEILRTEHCLR